MNHTHIKCETLEQNKHVQELLTNQGYKVGTLTVDQNLNILVNQQTKTYGHWVVSVYPYYTTHSTYQEFTMQKLKDLIKQAKKQGISQRALSVKLGHAQTYLSSMMARGISTSLQTELESRISDILNEPTHEQLKEENAKLSDLVKSHDKVRSHLGSRIIRLSTGNTKLEEENKALRFNVDLLQDEAKELSAENQRLSKTYTKLEQASRFSRLEKDALKDSIKSKSDAYDNLALEASMSVHTISMFEESLEKLEKENKQLKIGRIDLIADRKKDIESAIREHCAEQDELIAKLRGMIDDQARTTGLHRNQLSESLKTIQHWRTEAEKAKQNQAELNQTIDKLKAEAEANNTSNWMLWGALFMAVIVACILAI